MWLFHNEIGRLFPLPLHGIKFFLKVKQDSIKNPIFKTSRHTEFLFSRKFSSILKREKESGCYHNLFWTLKDLFSKNSETINGGKEVRESYQTFTRKYRPQKFQEVVGQEAIVTTLKNAIRLKRSAHAYLFSGSRGVGKTTLARLFAKALNCQNLDGQIEPCNECVSCKEIASSRSMDVIEIDGASNRGIDDMRQINETITYAPARGYKIYIIDEVHMLTKEAFNALLKTLEEPPPAVKFFFATTEAHKVLPTIISRCQRFDLTQISHESIVTKLQAIAKESSREVEEEAMHLIARFSEGSLRDAESFLDQIFCFEEGPLQPKSFIKHWEQLPMNISFGSILPFKKEGSLLLLNVSILLSRQEKIFSTLPKS